MINDGKPMEYRGDGFTHFIYRITTIDGYYYTVADEEARIAYNLGTEVKCERVAL